MTEQNDIPGGDECPSCLVAQKLAPHPCPYASEVFDSDELCECCEACEAECGMDV